MTQDLFLLIMLGAFLASCVFGVNVVYIILACGLFGALRTLLIVKKEDSGK